MPRITSLLAALTLVAAPASAERGPDEQLDAKLAVLERMLPDSAHAELAVDGIRERLERAAAATGLRLEAFAAKSSPSAAPPTLGATTIEATLLLRPGPGVDPARALHGQRLWPLVQTLSLMSRLATLASVAFSAEGADGLRMQVTLAVYHRPSAGLAGLALFEAKVAAIEQLRLGIFWPLERLAAITEATADHRAYLTGLVLRPDAIEAEGLAVWPAASASWKPGRAVERTAVSLQRDGGCERFRYEGRVRDQPPAAAEAPEAPERPLRWVLAAAAARLCDVPEPSSATLPPLRLSGSGPLSVEAANLDLHDLVLLLHREARQNVVVSEAVQGRLDVSLRGVTLEQALGALALFGVRASPPGRIRRVSMHEVTPVAPTRPGTGPDANLHVARARGGEVLALVQDITGEPTLLPSAPLPRVSVFVEDTPWDESFPHIAAALGLTMRREPGFVRFEADARPALAGVSSAGDDLDRGGSDGIADVACELVELAAVSSTRGAFTAWVPTPRGWLLSVRAGDRCWNGRVRSVDAEGMALEIDVSDPLSTLRTWSRVLKLRDR